jgi:hypothetical protein
MPAVAANDATTKDAAEINAIAAAADATIKPIQRKQMQ